MSQIAIHLNEPLSPPRIGGIAAAMAMHVAAFMLLMAPMSYVPQPVAESDFSTPVIDVIPPPPPMPPPPIDPVRKPATEIVPITHTPVATTPVLTPPVAYDNAGPNDEIYVPPQQEIIGEVIPPPSGPVSLSAEYAPAPNYPALSLRNGEEGTVLLLVSVGADGRPIDATIKKSSGYRDLDRNALKHVLATWRFHPAMFQGNPIPAMALVPVNYKIN